MAAERGLRTRIAGLLLGVVACASTPSYRQVDAGPSGPGAGGTAPPSHVERGGEVYEGRASYYARRFVGRKTASGERYDPARFTAAHAHLPLGTKIRVTRVPGGASVVVKVNDRCGCTHGRIVDLSEAAARKLDMMQVGVVPVRLEVLGR